MLIPEIEEFEKQHTLDVRVSGMPYIRTLNAQNIQDEILIFVLGALGITALIFFFFFRSFRATLSGSYNHQRFTLSPGLINILISDLN